MEVLRDRLVISANHTSEEEVAATCHVSVTFGAILRIMNTK